MWFLPAPLGPNNPTISPLFSLQPKTPLTTVRAFVFFLLNFSALKNHKKYFRFLSPEFCKYMKTTGNSFWAEVLIYLTSIYFKSKYKVKIRSKKVI